MKLLTKQHHAVFYLKDDITKELLYGGAAGGGKSALGCLWLIENCQKFPGSRWLMGRSKLKSLRETTLNTFFELTGKLKLNDQFKYNSQSHIIYWNNGSEILLKDLFLYPSDPDFDSLGSLEITGGFIDECNQVVYKAWQIVMSRCRYKLKQWDIHGEETAGMEVLERDENGNPILWRNSRGEETKGLIPKLLGTCNPAKNWVYREFYKLDREKALVPYRKFIQALPTDNPHLPTSYLDSLLSLDKNSKERLYFGNWEYDDDPAALIDMDAITDYFKPDHVERGETKYMTIDVARKGKDKTVIRIWEGLLCTSRHELKKSGVNEVVDMAKELRRKYKISLSRIIADEDGVGGGVVDYLKCKGFVNNSRPLNDENYDNLKSQCSFVMAKLIQDREAGELCYDGDVKDLVSEEMEQVKQKDIDKDGKLSIVPKDKVVEKIGRSPDDWDSIMMRAYFELAPKTIISKPKKPAGLNFGS